MIWFSFHNPPSCRKTARGIKNPLQNLLGGGEEEVQAYHYQSLFSISGEVLPSFSDFSSKSSVERHLLFKSIKALV